MIIMDFLTVEEVAKKLKIHPDTIKRLLRDGKMPGYKIGGSWRIKADELEAYIGKQKNIRPQ